MRNGYKILTTLLILLCAVTTTNSQSIKFLNKISPTPYIPVAIGSNFGYSIEMDDSIAVVGAPFYRNKVARAGAAFVFKYDGTAWNKVATLLASDTTANAFLGYSVAVDDSVIVLGARGYNANQGAGYVYIRPSGGWAGTVTQNARLTGDVPNPTSDVFLGFSAAVQNDVIALGGTFYDDKGAVLVYRMPAGGWQDTTQTATLLSNVGQNLDQLGYSLGIDNDVIIAGAINATVSTNQIGQGYVFEKPLGGWADTVYQSTILRASDAANGDLFGQDVAISGNVIIVGAPTHNSGSVSDAGAGYVFVKPGSNWAVNAVTNEAAKLTHAFKAANHKLGNNVDIHGDVIALKAFGRDSTYIYKKPTGGWTGNLTETVKLHINNFASPTFTATDVVISDSLIISGFFNQYGADNEGKVYSYRQPSTGWANAAQDNRLRQLTLSNSGDAFGSAVAMQGDIAVVGAYSDNEQTLNGGKVYILKYNGVIWQKVAVLQPSVPAYQAFFGAEVSIDNDIIAVSAWGMELFGTGSDKPTIFVFKRPTGGWAGTINESARLTPSTFASTGFGKSIDIDGDIIVVGASSQNTGAAESGAAYVFKMPSGGWSGDLNETAILKASVAEAYASFGTSVAVEGDVVVATAPRANVTGFDEGVVYVFNKPGGGWSGTQTESAKLIAADKGNYDYLGYEVDIDQSTIVAGCRYDFVTEKWQGSAYIFEKPAIGGWNGTINSSAKLIASDGGYNHRLSNRFVKIQGDHVFLSGVEDTINGNAGQGSVYAYTKPLSGWAGTLYEDKKIIAFDGQKEDYFGDGFAIDGYKMVIGASGDSSATEEYVGSVYGMNLYDLLSVTATDPDSIYGIGSKIHIVITFVDTVTVSGIPGIELNTGTVKQVASYLSGSGTAKLTFEYEVKENDVSMDLAYTSEDAILSAGAILDNGRKVFTNLPLPGADSSLSKNKNLVIDGIRPNVTITTLETTPTESDTFLVTITFDEDVDSFDINDIITANADLSNFVKIDDKTYTVDVSPVSGGDFTLQVPFAVGFDTANNGNKASNLLKLLYNEAGAPTVIITTNEPSRTNRSPFEVTVTFSEKVLNFDSTDIKVTNGMAGNVQSADSIVFTADITPAVEGMVRVLVDSAAAQDLGMNDNIIADSIELYYDPSSPNVTITSSAPNPTNVIIPVVITFSEWVSGFEPADITVINGSASNLQTNDSVVFTADVSPTADGLVMVVVKSSVVVDSATNFNNASNVLTRRYDITRPTVVITTMEGDTTAAKPIGITITFSEAVLGFSLGDIVVTGSASLSNLQTTDNIVYTADIDPVVDGLIQLDIPDLVVTDSAGNPNLAATRFKIVYIKTGIYDLHLAKQTTVYPNPASGQIIIDAPWVQGKYAITVTDMQGRVVLTHQANSTETRLDVSNLKEGIYFIRLESEQGVVIKKISKL